MNGASSLGARTVRRVESPSGCQSAMRPTASTWPETMCPPSSSPTLSEGSRFTRRSSCHMPCAVRLTVSAETSTANHAAPGAPPRSTTVRHTPDQAIEAPMAIAAGSNGQAMRTRKSPRCSTLSIVPTAVTIPVNMQGPFALRGVVDFERIAAKPAPIGEMPAFGHARRAGALERRDAFAEYGRCAVEQQAVDQPGGEERAGRRGTALDEQVLHL